MNRSRQSLPQITAACLSLLAILVIGLVSSGCSDSATNDGAAARATIGAAGGELRSLDRSLRLSIPAGALDSDTAISIAEIAPADMPLPLKDLGAARAWRLGPAGLQFAQPATLTLALPAGDEVVLLLHATDGRTVIADDAQLAFGAAGRTLSARLGHFSEIAVTTALGVRMLGPEVAPRELQVGDAATATFMLTKTDAELEADVHCAWEPGAQVASVLVQTGVPQDCSSPTSLLRGSPGEVQGTVAYRCVEPGATAVTAWFYLNAVSVFHAPVGDPLRGTMALRREVDVVCREKDAVPVPFAAGVQRLAIGSRPDGLRIHAESGRPKMWLAIAQGLLVYDLLSGLVEHNLTLTGAGAVGRDNLDVEAIASGAALAVFGASGNGGALRNRIAGNWGFTQLFLAAYLDAANAGNRLDAGEMVITSPTAGLGFVRFDAALNAFTPRPELSLRALLFLGNLVSAALVADQAGVLALSIGTDGGTTSTVWWHGRASELTPAIPLFAIPDPLGRRLRCAKLADGRVLCVVTAQLLGRAWVFTVDRPLELAVGAGPVGVQLGLGLDGLPVAVVANHDEGSFNLIRFDAAGRPIDNRQRALPAGCSRSAHVLLFVYLLREWLAGTCPAEDSYFLLPA